MTKITSYVILSIICMMPLNMILMASGMSNVKSAILSLIGLWSGMIYWGLTKIVGEKLEDKE